MIIIVAISIIQDSDIDDDANIDEIYADNRDVDIHDSDIDHRSIEIITELLLQRNSTRIHTT